MFSLIGWIIFGAVVGIIARFIMPGRDPMGWVMTIVLGIAGSLLGGMKKVARGVTTLEEVIKETAAT
jgi:uncharacterized membrane protein YeaQ/YmgE (transglycosylase-associated protein family)